MQLIRHIVLLTVVLGASIAYAVPITYTFTGTATGTLGSTPFTNAMLTISVTLDTNNILNPSSGFFQNPYAPNAATFSIGGIGSGTLSNNGAVLGSQTQLLGNVRIADNTVGALIVIGDTLIGSTALASYSLATPIGPLGPETTSPFSFPTVPTSSGSLAVTSIANMTFQATVSSAGLATPIPPSLYLCLGGLACLGFYRARQHRTRLAQNSESRAF
jgi:hypothetical protein